MPHLSPMSWITSIVFFWMSISLMSSTLWWSSMNMFYSSIMQTTLNMINLWEWHLQDGWQ